MTIFRYVVYAATDDVARKIWQEFRELCASEGREGRMRLASSVEAGKRFDRHDLPAVVAASDSTECETEVVWRGSVPPQDQIMLWARTFSTPEEIKRREREGCLEFAHVLAAERASAPRSLDEAVQRIVADLSVDERTRLLAMQESELIQFHFTWGMGIRNSWLIISPPPILTGETVGPSQVKTNDALLESCGKKLIDDASMVIIRTAWQEVRRRAVGG